MLANATRTIFFLDSYDRQKIEIRKDIFTVVQYTAISQYLMGDDDTFKGQYELYSLL